MIMGDYVQLPGDIQDLLFASLSALDNESDQKQN